MSGKMERDSSFTNGIFIGAENNFKANGKFSSFDYSCITAEGIDKS